MRGTDRLNFVRVSPLRTYRVGLVIAAATAVGCNDFPSTPSVPPLAFESRLPLADTLSVLDTTYLDVLVRDAKGNSVTGATITAISSDPSIISVAPTHFVLDTVQRLTIVARSAGRAEIALSVESGIGEVAAKEFSDTVLVTERWVTASVSVGGGRACGVTANAKAYCWGNGSLGDGSLDSSLGPVRILSAAPISRISVGGAHVCVTESHGFPYCWGSNRYGEVGDGTQFRRVVPVPVAVGAAFREVTTGNDFSCGVTITGETFCWGDAGRGQLGNANILSEGCRVIDVDIGYVCALAPSVPVTITTSISQAVEQAYCTIDSSIFTRCKLNLTTVSAAFDFACGLTPVGAAFCWGNAKFVGGTPYGPPCNYVRNPVPCSSIATLAGGGAGWATSELPYAGPVFVSLSTGGQTCALEQGGRPFCWGGDNFAPTALPTTLRFKAISVGYSHVCALTDDGTAYCWGTNAVGELGTGSVGSTETDPEAVAGHRAYSSISAGAGSTCAVSLAGPMFCWGSNGSGQLGTGDKISSPTPTRILEPQR